METGIQTWSFKGAEIRTVMVGGEPHWLAVDVCKILELANVTDALSRLDTDEKHTLDTSEGMPGIAKQVQSVATVTESGLYHLIMTSRKEEAREFRRWVTHEVLPMIRRTGGYMTPKLAAEAAIDPSALIPMLKAAAEQLEQAQERNRLQSAEIGRLAPKAEYTDAVLQSAGLHTVNSIAVHLGVSAVALNRWLESEGLIYRQGDTIYPRSDLRGIGLCDFHVVHYTAADGGRTREHLKWTESGRKWIIERWNRKHATVAI